MASKRRSAIERIIWRHRRRHIETCNAVVEPLLDFDEADYLAANPDVAAAVAAGGLPSGEHHYRLYGVYERRAIRLGERPSPLPLPFPDGMWALPRDKLLAGLDVSHLQGVEIGALAAPAVRRSEGPIFYVDFTDTAALKQQYASDPNVSADDIVDVDGIWGDRTLKQCVGETFEADYVVASHVVEHTPDLITWLTEIRSILRPNGSLRLVVPDRRYTFDYLRFETRISDVLDAYMQKARTPLPRLIIDFCSLSREVDCAAAWNGELNKDQLKHVSSTRFGYDLAKIAVDTGRYFDTHCWVFTPTSFINLCLEMATLDLLGFACEAFITTARNQVEFFVHMTPSDSKEAILESWRKAQALVVKAGEGAALQIGA